MCADCVLSRGMPVRDLAEGWQDLYKLVDRTPADPREILHGLKAVQDDAIVDWCHH